MTKYLPFRFVLKSPTLITALDGDPNSAVSMSYIPGSTIKGVLASALLEQADRNQEAKDLLACLLTPQSPISCLNCYPEIDCKRSIPVPLSWKYEKNSEGKEWTDLLTPRARPLSGKLGGGEGHYWIPDAQDSCFRNVKPSFTSRLHNQRERKKGRAWQDEDGTSHGAIFFYEALDAGQVFRGEFLITGNSQEECEQRAQVIKEALDGRSLFIGRSRRAGYGHISSLEFFSLEGNEHASWRYNNGLDTRWIADSITAGQEFFVLLTSPCLVRHPDTGMIDPSALDETLAVLFENKAKVSEKKKRAWSFEMVGGFNRKWKLELPQQLAVSAGSVISMEARHDMDKDFLERIMHKGFGERQSDGFGRILILSPTIPATICQKKDESKSSSQGITSLPQSTKLSSNLELLQNRLFDNRMKILIAQEASSRCQNAQGKIPNPSLLGRLRTNLRLPPRDALARLEVLLKEEDNSNGKSASLKKTAMTQLEQYRLNGTSLKDLLLELKRKDSDKLEAHFKTELMKLMLLPDRKNTITDYIEENADRIKVALIEELLSTIALAQHAARRKEQNHD